jgi:hypothetical protein
MEKGWCRNRPIRNLRQKIEVELGEGIRERKRNKNITGLL